MTQDEIIQFAAARPGVAVETASQATGAPQVAWGDSFIFYDAPGQDTPPDRRFPFATIVIKDYPGFDEFASHQGAPDYRALDTVLPHPTYGQQAWISIVCPGPRTSDLARALLTQAHARLADRARKS